MYLLFDIGGTKTRLAISSDGKTLGASKIIPTEPNFEKAMEEIKKGADELSGHQRMDGVSGGVPGPLDKDKTMVISAPNIKGWNNKPLKKELETLFSCPVVLGNDAEMAALGEALFGAGKDKKIVVYMTISTGVGGARVVNGKIDENVLGFEPGHQIIVPNGNTCTCGGKGHLQAYVSGSGLYSLKGVRAEEIKDPDVWDSVAKHLAIGLNNVSVFWSPDIIVLGGSVMASVDIEKVRINLKEVLTIFKTTPEVVLSEHKDNSGLLGALSQLQKS